MANTESAKDIDVLIGGRLKARRRALRITQVDLAASLRVGSQQVQKYECGKSRLSAAQLCRLGKILDVSAGYFLEGVGRELKEMAAPGRHPAALPRQGFIDGREFAAAMSQAPEPLQAGVLALAQQPAPQEP